MMIRVGQPPTNSAAPITTAPNANWRALPPRLIDVYSPLRRAARKEPMTRPTTVSSGQPAPAAVTNRFLPSGWLAVQAVRRRHLGVQLQRALHPSSFEPDPAQTVKRGLNKGTPRPRGRRDAGRDQLVTRK